MKYTLPSAHAMAKAFPELSKTEWKAKLDVMRSSVHSWLAKDRHSWTTYDNETFPKTAEWVRSCYHAPHSSELVMSFFDEAIGSFGVVYVSKTETKNRKTLGFCNNGDTYADTVLHYAGSSRFFIGNWGDCIR